MYTPVFLNVLASTTSDARDDYVRTAENSGADYVGPQDVSTSTGGTQFTGGAARVYMLTSDAYTRSQFRVTYYSGSTEITIDLDLILRGSGNAHTCSFEGTAVPATN
jgi:hypothetical protein